MACFYRLLYTKLYYTTFAINIQTCIIEMLFKLLIPFDLTAFTGYIFRLYLILLYSFPYYTYVYSYYMLIILECFAVASRSVLNSYYIYSIHHYSGEIHAHTYTHICAHVFLYKSNQISF